MPSATAVSRTDVPIRAVHRHLGASGHAVAIGLSRKKGTRKTDHRVLPIERIARLSVACPRTSTPAEMKMAAP